MTPLDILAILKTKRGTLAGIARSITGLKGEPVSRQYVCAVMRSKSNSLGALEVRAKCLQEAQKINRAKRKKANG